MNATVDVDLDEVRSFYDPHPGFAGAAIPIPGPIKTVADALDGRKMSLREALARLREVGVGDVQVVAQYSYIGLRIGGTGRHAEHFFRVIRFR